jgi:LysM repeat protein
VSGLRVYIVRRGDTFFKIARRFGLTTTQLRYYNPQVTNINRIYVGQRLYVP